MKNMQKMLAAGAVLVTVTVVVISSPESDFTLSPGFDRKTEIGYLGDEKSEYDYQENCKGGIANIRPSRDPDHIATLTDNFDKSIIKVKVKVEAKATPEKVNPGILIKAVTKEEIICEKNDESDLIYFSYQNTDEIEADTYQVWVGDTEENNNLTKDIKYIIEVTEEPNY